MSLIKDFLGNVEEDNGQIGCENYFDSMQFEWFHSKQFAHIVVDEINKSSKPFNEKVDLLDKYYPHGYDNPGIHEGLSKLPMKDLMKFYHEIVDIHDCGKCAIANNPNTVEFCIYCNEGDNHGKD